VDLDGLEPVPAPSDAEQLPRRSSKNPDFTKALRNSAAVGVDDRRSCRSSVGAFCAYALARLRIAGKSIMLAIVLTISTFPQIAIAAPLFKLWSDIGLFNTWTGLVIPYLTFALPLTIYILVSVLQGDPEGSRGGGAGRRRDALPGVPEGRRPAGRAGPRDRRDPDVHRRVERVPAGGDADVVVEGAHRPRGDRVLHRRDGARGAVRSISAASVTISIPLIIMVLLFQKRIVAGLTAGAVKG
jgi:multiple sugar transport system permease protein